MKKEPIPSVKGTRDFYPSDQAIQNWLRGVIQKISQKYGYQEFEGPELEYLDLYTDKTSREILEDQVFILKDRDERDLVLRPELTPTLARMVAQRSAELPAIIRWYCFGRAWRYERPQKGRGREFFQWEINILGPETPEADAEILAVAADFFRELNLTPLEVTIRVNDRAYFDQILKENNIDQKKFIPLLRVIDRQEKISLEEFTQSLANEGLTSDQIEAIKRYLSERDYSRSPWLTQVFESLENYPGVREYVTFDPTIARGFDYYTRTVFEAWDKTGQLKRSLFGGGRFDDLTATLGGQHIPGVGMAPGDMPIEALLRSLDKLPIIRPITARALVTAFDEKLASKSTRTAATLRQAGISVESWVGGVTKLDKQLKYASHQNIPFVVIIGPDEAKDGKLTIKNMQSGDQQTVDFERAIEILKGKV
jgi:histidyl-tRNA synthetase